MMFLKMLKFIFLKVKNYVKYFKLEQIIVPFVTWCVQYKMLFSVMNLKLKVEF